MTRILVTGGAGFIGHHLVARLVSDGYDVVVLDNLRRGSFERFALRGARLLVGDVRNAADCQLASTGCDAVVHLAAQSNVMGSHSEPDYTVATNVDGTWKVAGAATRAGVGRFVFASSREVYGDPAHCPVHETAPLHPKNLYGATKLAGEILLGALPPGSPSVSILRFANVIGEGDSDRVVPRWIEAARSGRPLIMFGGDQVIDFVPIDTAVEALVQALERSPMPVEPVNIGSGVPTTLRQLAARVLVASATSSAVEVVPGRAVEVREFVADVRRMRAVLGITPPADPLATVTAMLSGTS
jgi:UDP-glucose 4-epimerase